MADVHGSGLREHILMASRFLRNPRTVGAVSASSRAMARMMVANIPVDRPVRVIELGPGTGPFTSAIVKRIAPGSRVLAIELEETFAKQLRRRWPSVETVCASAVHMAQIVEQRQLQPVDYVVSGLPFASLRVDETSAILDGIQQTLRPGGTFTTFQYLHGFGLAPGRIFRREMSRRMGVAPERTLVLKNFPFSVILRWTKPA